MEKDDLNLVNRYLDGELDREAIAAFENRLHSDAAMRDYVDDMRALAASADALDVIKAPEIEPPSGISMPFQNISSSLKPFIAGAIVAAACVLLGIGIGLKVDKTPMTGAMTEAFRIVYFAPEAESVSVLGDFNGWTGEIPLEPRGEEGYWLAELHVKPGEYRYVLLVDGKERPGDPLADYIIDDDFGSKNSVVRIGL